MITVNVIICFILKFSLRSFAIFICLLLSEINAFCGKYLNLIKESIYHDHVSIIYCIEKVCEFNSEALVIKGSFITLSFIFIFIFEFVLLIALHAN